MKINMNSFIKSTNENIKQLIVFLLLRRDIYCYRTVLVFIVIVFILNVLSL